MINFHQNIDSFFVEETLSYEPSGEGDYIYVQIRKKGTSTRGAKLRLSECTGVPMEEIRHAGLKDGAATATQWLSWKEAFQRSPHREMPGVEILRESRHSNNLVIGHVRGNRFRLHVQKQATDTFPSQEVCADAFPNFYGPQRFGSAVYDRDLIIKGIGRPCRKKHVLNSMQSWLFNDYLSQRLAESGRVPLPGDMWTASNGKTWFLAEPDETLLARYKQGQISPSGPMFGYKTKISDRERTYLAGLGLETEAFRRWGKKARGSRRPLWVKPEYHGLELSPEEVCLDFSLPSGAYATVYLTHLFLPELLTEPIGKWPNFTEQVCLSSASV